MVFQPIASLKLAWRAGTAASECMRPGDIVGQGRTIMLYHDIEDATPSETTYTRLCANLATVLDEVIDQQATVIVRR